MTIKFLSKLKRRKTGRLEFCQKNVERFFDEDSLQAFSLFFQEGKIDMQEYQCLSQCERCSDKPYVKLNGEIIEADNAMELLSTIQLKTGSVKLEH